MLTVLDETHDFRSQLSATLAFVQAHKTLTCAIHHPATYASTRWASIHQSCSWLLARRMRILEFAMSVGKETSLPPPSWWLCLFGVESITRRICKTFEKMQYLTISPREQVAKLSKLNADLGLVSQRQDVPGGPVEFCNKKLESLISGADVDAWFAYQAAPSDEKETLLKAITLAIKTFTSGIDGICAKSDGVPMLPQTPFELVHGDIAVFMHGLQRHRTALARFGGERLVKAVASDRQNLITAYASGGKLKDAIDETKNKTFSAAWGFCVELYPNMFTYCAGLATVLPATHTVEADFSVLKYTKDSNRSSLSNYSMEGQMQAKQYFSLPIAVASVKRAHALVITVV